VGAQFTLLRIAEAPGAMLEGDPARVIRGGAPLEGARLETRVREIEGGPHA